MGCPFIYGIALTTDLAGVVGALQDGHPLLILGHGPHPGRAGLQDRGLSLPHVGADTYEAANTPFVAWLSVAPKAAGFVVMFRLYLEGVGNPVLLWVPLMTGLAAVTIVAGNLMAIPQQNIKRLLAYSGIAHIGYMLVGFAAVSVNGVAMMLFYLVATSSGTWAPSSSWKPWRRPTAPRPFPPTRGWPSARPSSHCACSSSSCPSAASLRGTLLAKPTSFWAAAEGQEEEEHAQCEDGRALGQPLVGGNGLGAVGLRHGFHDEEGAHVPEEVGDQVESIMATPLTDTAAKPTSM